MAHNPWEVQVRLGQCRPCLKGWPLGAGEATPAAHVRHATPSRRPPAHRRARKQVIHSRHPATGPRARPGAHCTAMDPLRILAEEQGFFTRAQAREAGYSDRGVRRMIQGGVWRRIRRGYYTFSDLWLSLSAEQRHLARARAVLHHLGPAVALSHVSGCLAHGIDVWDVDLSRVHVTRLDGGAGRVEGDVVHHEGYCADADVAEVDGILVLCPERCALETAATVDKERGLVVVDSLLYHGHCSKKALTARFRLMARWPGIQHLQVVVPLADGRSQSPGESRGRYLFWPPPARADSPVRGARRGRDPRGHLRLGVARP